MSGPNVVVCSSPCLDYLSLVLLELLSTWYLERNLLSGDSDFDKCLRCFFINTPSIHSLPVRKVISLSLHYKILIPGGRWGLMKTFFGFMAGSQMLEACIELLCSQGLSWTSSSFFLVFRVNTGIRNMYWHTGLCDSRDEI